VWLYILNLSLSLIFIVFIIFASFTNQIHAWSHTNIKDTPFIVYYLQKYKIILEKKEHKKHHIYPHKKGYCITTGHLNKILDNIKFWDKLEKIFILKYKFYKKITE
jgi:ubiquitin-conjugating enzyme E2 variant